MSSVQNSKTRIFYLDFLRVFAIFNIIANHAMNRAFYNFSCQELDLAAMSMPGTVLKAFLTMFSRVGVFLFVMITGKLILNKDFTQEGALPRFLKHNWLSLSITTELWFFLMFWELQLLGEKVPIGSLFQTLLFTNQVTMNNMWYMNMLLVVYLVLPVFALALRKLSPKVFLLPLGLLLLGAILVPTANDLLGLLGSHRDIDFAFQPKYLFSMFAIYLILGYFLDKGLLENLSSSLLYTTFALTLIAMTAVQVYGYESPKNYLFDNSNFGFLVLALCIFEGARRHADAFERFREPVTRLSGMTFAIYLLHMCVMHAMHYFMQDLGLNHWLYFVILYVGSIVGSLLFITLGSRSKIIKQYFFLIK